MATGIPYEVPLAGGARSLGVTLSGVEYRMRLTYNATPATPCWIMDIGDADGNRLVCGIPMLPRQDLLAQYRHLGFVGSLYVFTPGAPDTVPTFDGLGSVSRLYYQPD